jgi:hypothetical protein
MQEIEGPLPKLREVILHDKNVETNMNVGRSMGNARPLVAFNQSDLIQVDFGPLINYRRKEEHQHVSKRVEGIFDQEMSGESIQKIFEEEREEYNRDEPSDSKNKWEKIGLKLEDEWEGVDIEKVLQEGPSQQGYSLCAIEPTH